MNSHILTDPYKEQEMDTRNSSKDKASFSEKQGSVLDSDRVFTDASEDCSSTFDLKTVDDITSSQSKISIDEIPNELLRRICMYLHPNTLFKVIELNKRFSFILHDSLLWHELCIQRFGESKMNDFIAQDYKETVSIDLSKVIDTTVSSSSENKEKSTISYRDVYKKLDATSYYISPEKLEICWGDSPTYWKKLKNDQDKIIEMRCLRVCWFDVRAMLFSVPQGKYELIFDITTYNTQFSKFPIEINVFRPGFENNKQTFNGQINNLVERGKNVVCTVEVLESYSTVEIIWANHSQTWKSGLSIFGINLKYIDDDLNNSNINHNNRIVNSPNDNNNGILNHPILRNLFINHFLGN